MRIYLPATLTALAAALRASHLGAPPVRAFAVTPAFREWYASGDISELEYAAMAAAARASLRLLAADPDAPQRRVVLAADVPDEAVECVVNHSCRAAVLVTAVVPMSKVVCAHVDDPEAVTDVGAAVAALLAADGGDDDARFVVDGAEGHELLWFATSELPYLLG